jgi:hypothetical protein
MEAGELKQLFQDIISRRLPSVEIIDIKVKRDVDTDGDEVLDVTVIFEAPADLDPQRVVGLVRHLRPYLQERGERAFPVMSFVSQKEAKRRGFVAG